MHPLRSAFHVTQPANRHSRLILTSNLISTAKGANVNEGTPQSGLSDNAAGALAYVTVIPAIVFLVAEPYNKNSYIKFHAWQSIFLGIAWFAISIIAIIPILGWLIFILGSITLLIAWIIVLLKGERYKLPFIGDLAEKQAAA
jgi:uncharacterized membrane protein